MASVFVKNFGLDSPVPGGAEEIFAPERNFFKKGLILSGFSVIIRDCMKYCCEEV